MGFSLLEIVSGLALSPFGFTRPSSLQVPLTGGFLANHAKDEQTRVRANLLSEGKHSEKSDPKATKTLDPLSPGSTLEWVLPS